MSVTVKRSNPPRKVGRKPTHRFSAGNMISVTFDGDPAHLVGLVLEVEEPSETGNSFYVVKILTDSGEVLKTWISTLDQVEILC